MLHTLFFIIHSHSHSSCESPPHPPLCFLLVTMKMSLLLMLKDRFVCLLHALCGTLVTDHCSSSTRLPW